MQRLTLVVRGPVIDRTDLLIFKKEDSSELEIEDLIRMDLRSAVVRLEKYLIERALVEANGNRAEAARRLGIHRQLLYAKMKEHGIEG